jgi:N-acetylglucosamine kinase-like BadF-type ATPase
VDADDVGAFAVELKRAAYANDPVARDVASELSLIFADAVQRIAQLTGPHRQHVPRSESRAV